MTKKVKRVICLTFAVLMFAVAGDAGRVAMKQVAVNCCLPPCPLPPQQCD